LAPQEIQKVASLFHILAWDVLVTTNAKLWQIGQKKIPFLLHPHFQVRQK
jgi:hypothetical protein